MDNKNKASTDTQYLLRAIEALANETDPVALQKILMRCMLDRSGADEGYFFSIIKQNPTDVTHGKDAYEHSKALNTDNHTTNALHNTVHHCSLHGIAHKTRGENSLNTAIKFDLHPDSIPLHYNDIIIKECKKTLKTIAINTVNDQAAYKTKPATLNNSPKSILCKPVVHQQKLLAIIYLHDYSTENLFDEQLLTFFELLEKQTAITIRNYQLLQKQMLLNNKITQNQKTLEAVFNNTRHYFLIMNTDGRVIKVNSSSIKDFGIAEADILGKQLWEIPWYENSKELKNDVKYYFLMSLKEGRQTFETYYYESNNSERSYLENIYSPAFDNDGNLNFIILESHDISKIKKTEETLKDSNKKFQFALEGSQQGIFEANFKTGEMYISKEVKAMLGEKNNNTAYSIGQWEEKIHPKDLENAWKNLTSHINKSTHHYTNECRTRNNNNVYIWMLYRGMATELTDSKEPLKVIGTISDISNRKLIEKTLKESENRYRGLFENAIDGIMILDTNGIILDANKATLSILNFHQANDITGKPFISLLDDKEHTDFKHIRQQAFALKTIEFESTCLTRTGNAIPVDIRGRLFTNNNDSNFLILLRDITEKKKTEKNLKTSETLFRQFFQQHPVSTLLANPDGTVHLINPAYEKEWVVDKSAFANNKYNVLSDENFTKDAKTIQLISQALAGKTVFLDDIEYTSNSKNPAKWARIIGFPIKDESGKLIHTVFTHQIITLEVEALQEIELHRRHLQDMIEERTHHLEIANEELKNFAYIVSHDLKAPLRAITQLSNWLITDYQDKLDSNGNEQLLLIGNRAGRMNNMIEAILQYSRIGRTNEVWENTNLKDLINETIDLLAPPDTINFEVAKDLPTLRCQKISMQQVFQNLIDNAVKYMNKEDGLVQIGFKEFENNWQFFVKDNGSGIHLKHQQRIFQMFQTLHNKEDIDSTGIGLSLVKKIIEQWQGLLWIESTPGEGSCFYFTFPKHQQQLLTVTTSE